MSNFDEPYPAGMRMATGTRRGDSRFPCSPAWQFSHDKRPPVGQSRVYQGAEIERHNDNKISSNSPGPIHRQEPGTRVAIPSYSRNPPAYSMGGLRHVIDKRFSPSPGHYGYAAAKCLGPQRIDSSLPSKPSWGMGSGTRDQRDMLHLAPYYVNNLTTLTCLGGNTRIEALDHMNDRSFLKPPPAKQALNPYEAQTIDLAAETSIGGHPIEDKTKPPSKESLGRALAVAMAAKQAQTDPELAGALKHLHARVATLRAGGA